MNAPKKPTCIIKNYAIASFIIMMKPTGKDKDTIIEKAKGKHHFHYRRRFVPAVPLPKSRNVETQAVFSLRGKPLNCFGLTKKVVYENEEFNLLQHALNIEEGYEGLRYNNIVIATDADVDGMHIRLLLMTFFLQFFPDLVKNNHVYILETPLFRVRNKQETIYCYDEKEKQDADKKTG